MNDFLSSSRGYYHRGNYHQTLQFNSTELFLKLPSTHYLCFTNYNLFFSLSLIALISTVFGHCCFQQTSSDKQLDQVSWLVNIVENLAAKEAHKKRGNIGLQTTPNE